MFFDSLKLISAQCCFDVETSHLFCRARQMTGFYIKCNTGMKWVKWVYKLNALIWYLL